MRKIYILLIIICFSYPSFGFGIDSNQKFQKKKPIKGPDKTQTTQTLKAHNTSSNKAFHCDGAIGSFQLERKLNSKCDPTKAYSVFYNAKFKKTQFCCVAR